MTNESFKKNTRCASLHFDAISGSSIAQLRSATMPRLHCFVLLMACLIGHASSFLFTSRSQSRDLANLMARREILSLHAADRLLPTTASSGVLVQSMYPRLAPKLLKGLKAYRSLFNTTKIPADFKVPAEHTDDAAAWAPSLRGYGLGRALYVATRKTRGATGVIVVLNETTFDAKVGAVVKAIDVISATTAKAKMVKASAAPAGPIPVEFSLISEWNQLEKEKVHKKYSDFGK
jgi:hypothetical protein